VILVDPPSWPAHGRLWSHLVSDRSPAELHDFARRLGIPERGFARDHYDVPAQRYDAVVAAGAVPVGSRELVRRLAASGLRRRGGTPGPYAPGSPLQRPRRLRPGDGVAIVAPAGPVPVDLLDEGIAVLESWGLVVRPGRHLRTHHPALEHLAATDRERATDLRAAWCDPEVAAVWAARGGFGCHRIVDVIDWSALAAAGPRVLVGFSDVTALHEAVAERLGLATVHGPVVTSLGHRRACAAAREQVRRLLFEPDDARTLATQLRTLAGGAADGVLVGGNLRVLAAGLGTAVSRPARGAIAVLEDVGEQAYRIDGMLTQLLRTGWFDGVRGVVAGAFTQTGDTDVEAVLRDRLGPLQVPAVTGAPVGHIGDNIALPLGVPARLDADAGTLVLTRAPLA